MVLVRLSERMGIRWKQPHFLGLELRELLTRAFQFFGDLWIGTGHILHLVGILARFKRHVNTLDQARRLK